MFSNWNKNYQDFVFDKWNLRIFTWVDAIICLGRFSAKNSFVFLQITKFALFANYQICLWENKISKNCHLKSNIFSKMEEWNSKILLQN